MVYGRLVAARATPLCLQLLVCLRSCRHSRKRRAHLEETARSDDLRRVALASLMAAFHRFGELVSAAAGVPLVPLGMKSMLEVFVPDWDLENVHPVVRFRSVYANSDDSEYDTQDLD